MPEVMEFYRMARDIDYMLRVVVSDMSAYDQFYKRLIEAIPLKSVTSRFAMQRIKATTAYPLPLGRMTSSSNRQAASTAPLSVRGFNGFIRWSSRTVQILTHSPSLNVRPLLRRPHGDGQDLRRDPASDHRSPQDRCESARPDRSVAKTLPSGTWCNRME